MRAFIAARRLYLTGASGGYRLMVVNSSHHRGFSCRGARALGRVGSVAAAPGSGAQAQLTRSTCNLPGSGIEPMALALAGRFFATEPPGKFSKITWSVKGLSALVKRQSLPDQKPQPNYMLSMRKPL